MAGRQTSKAEILRFDSPLSFVNCKLSSLLATERISIVNILVGLLDLGRRHIIR